MVEEANAPVDAPDAPAAAEDREHWPRREDTREFEAVSLPEHAEEDENGGTPLPPPLPPAAQQEEGEIESPWSGKDFAWG